MAYAPDINNPIPMPVDNGNNNNHRGGGNRLPAFQPGQLKALASQLSVGFGGGLGAWKRNLRNTYDPTPMKDFNFGGSHGGGNNNNGGGNNNNGGGNNPGTGPKPGDGGFDPSRPDHRMAPMMAQQPMQQQAQQMQMPQMGLLAGQMQPMQQGQQPQQQNPLGDIPPEVLAFIRSRGV